MCYTFNIMIANKIYLGKQQHFLFQSLTPRAFQLFIGRTAKQKNKKERGLEKKSRIVARNKFLPFCTLRAIGAVVVVAVSAFPLVRKKQNRKFFKFY